MAVAVVNIRALRNEADWLPNSLDEADLVVGALRDAGVPDQQVNAMVGWLVAKSTGRPDGSTQQTRSRYRKVLAELDSPLSPRNNGAIPRYFNSDMAA